MSMNEFASGTSETTSFLVKNITIEPKVVNIFNYPIMPNCTRDILQIPGVGESDIRASLLKGEIRTKLQVQDIYIVYSDIDLLQFNTNEFSFLSSYGVNTGLNITPAQTSGINIISGNSNYALIQNANLVGTKNSVNRTFFTSNSFIDGAYNGNTFHIELFHNGRKLANGKDFAISITGHNTGMFNTINFISFTPNFNSVLNANYYIAIV